MLSHGELQLSPPPSSVAHSSADCYGGIELDYVSLFYYTCSLSTLINATVRAHLKARR